MLQPDRVPDGLTTLRQFVGGLNRSLNDQSFGNEDGFAYNPTAQFATAGPYSTVVEGRPVTISTTGGLQLSPTVLMLGLAVGVGYWLSKRA